eukprot:UC1_evm1s1298
MGTPATAKQISDALKKTKYDKSGRLSFIEYLLFKYERSAVDLFSANADKLKKVDLTHIDAAVAHEQKLAEEKELREARIEGLRAVVAGGGAGSAKAKIELRQLEMANRNEDAAAEHMAVLNRLKAVKTVPRDL